MKEDGGPAFPCEGAEFIETGTVDGGGKIGKIEKINRPGMSLRDYFAAAALQGLLAGVDNNAPARMDRYSNGAPIDRSPFATTAYQYADAMLAERAK